NARAVPGPSRESGSATAEVEELRLLVGTGRRRDLRGEAAGSAHGLVDRREKFDGARNAVGIEPLVLTGGAGEVPRVYQRVGAQQPAHQRHERLITEHPTDDR